MLGRKEWRVRTPFSEVLVRLGSFGSQPAAGADARALLGELLFELHNLNPEVVRALLEVHHALNGLGGLGRQARPQSISRQQALTLERDLRLAQRNGRLSVELEPRVMPGRRSGADVVRLGPEAAVDEVTTFIGIRVLDDAGKPVQGERVRVDFADGSVRNLRTGADGSIFIDNLNPGGAATVTLTERNEPGDAEAPLPPDTFEAKFVDETGQGIDGVEIVFSHSTQDQSQITDGDGMAKIHSLEPVTVRFADMGAVGDLLSPRWAEAREVAIPEGDNVQVFAINGDVDDVSLVSGALSTIVITPPTGVLHAELWDKTGRVRHANRDYTIDGPIQLSGTTDDQGRLFHEDVFPGDYKLTLTLEHFEGEDHVTDTYETPLVVQAP